MSTPTAAQGEFRPEIEQGWTRSALSGLEQAMEVRDPVMTEVNLDSRLRRAASPVLDSVSEHLLGTRFSLLLADRSARIVDRRVGGRAPAMTLERVKAVPGAQYVESVSGTNALATAFETKQPVSVSGSEHFLEALRVFSCFGAPIIHPITGRLEGVLDITGPHEDENDLLKPFLLRAVFDIADRLRSGSRLSDQRLFEAFQSRTAKSVSPVVAFGYDLVLSNKMARDLLTEQDMHAVLLVAQGYVPNRPGAITIPLASGPAATLRIEHIEGTNRSTIVELELCGDAAARYPRKSRFPYRRDRDSEVERPANQRILVIGEPGVGKTTHARSIASALATAQTTDHPGAAEFGYLDSAETIGTGAELSKGRLQSLTGHSSVLVIDNIHLLNSVAAEVIRQVVRSFNGHVVLVSDSAEAKDPSLGALQALATQRESLPALRDRREEIGTVVDDVVRTISRTNRTESTPPDQTLHVVPGALEVLGRQEWPGNRNELQAVLVAAARGRSVGAITLADLPITHRYPEVGALSRLERVERRAILDALALAGGNKKSAAADLGIGRTTLYTRLRYYRIDI